MTSEARIADLPRFSAPYDWNAIDDAVRSIGGAILRGALTEGDVRQLNTEIDSYLLAHEDQAQANTGSALYDQFLGHKTLRLHGLVEKIPSSQAIIGRDALIDWAERLTAPVAGSVQLNAGELIQIQPGEPAQLPHRDTDSWIQMPLSEAPLMVNAIFALDDMTLENGATHVAPYSHSWAAGRMPAEDEFARAVMSAGDAVLFRGDVIHGGGANMSSGRRRALSISYCAGWLRPVENSYLNVSHETVRTLPKRLQNLLGYAVHDGTALNGGIVGLYENGDPSRALEHRA